MSLAEIVCAAMLLVPSVVRLESLDHIDLSRKTVSLSTEEVSLGVGSVLDDAAGNIKRLATEYMGGYGIDLRFDEPIQSEEFSRIGLRFYSEDEYRQVFADSCGRYLYLDARGSPSEQGTVQRPGCLEHTAGYAFLKGEYGIPARTAAFSIKDRDIAEYRECPAGFVLEKTRVLLHEIGHLGGLYHVGTEVVGSAIPVFGPDLRVNLMVKTPPAMQRGCGKRPDLLSVEDLDAYLSQVQVRQLHSGFGGGEVWSALRDAGFDYATYVLRLNDDIPLSSGSR